MSGSVCAIESLKETHNYHRIYIEPDFAFNLMEKFYHENVSGKHWGQYYGMCAGYEFLKPNVAYFELGGILSVGSRNTEWHLPDSQKVKANGNAFKNNIEGIFGYPVKTDPICLIPFTGFGGYFLSDSDLLTDLAYIPLGLKAEYQIDRWNIGLKAEQMHFVHTWESYRGDKKSVNLWGANVWGYEISLPISVKSDIAEENWLAAFEPYYLKLSQNMTYVGGRISAIHFF